MARRTVSPLAAPIAQSIAVVVALNHGQEIDVKQAQHALDWGTSWPHGTELTTRTQLRAWFASRAPVPA